MAWRVPPVMADLGAGQISAPADSPLLARQKALREATLAALRAAVEDVRAGLLETVGINSRFAQDERTAVEIDLPAEADRELIARAIDMEHVEAWLAENGAVRVGVGPWYSTKDVDQVVLSVTKVVHVLLGLHAPERPKSLFARVLSSAMDIAALQETARKKN